MAGGYGELKEEAQKREVAMSYIWTHLGGREPEEEDEWKSIINGCYINVWNEWASVLLQRSLVWGKKNFDIMTWVTVMCTALYARSCVYSNVIAYGSFALY